MTYQSSIGWLGACLLGSALLAGCKDTDTQTRAPVRQPVSVVRPPAMAPTGAVVVATKPSADALPAAPNSGAVQQVSDESSVPSISTTAAKVPSHRGEDSPQRKSFMDITAHPSFAHAPDYSWLSGEVEYSRISKGWRLRYASVDEDDPYGGSVTLAEHPLLHGLKDGQHVRVQGRLSNPSVKCSAPPYLIDSLQPLDPPEAAADAPPRH